MNARLLLLALLPACSAFASEVYPFWIQPCPEHSACEPGDPQLAQWAFEAWQRESDGAIVFKKSPGEEHARIRLRWADGSMSLYGETEPLTVDGKPGAVIYVLPSVAMSIKGDRLMRDAIVYLTCVHETGHALGLRHTAEFADIMYSFQYGGDIPAYFERYRRLLTKRDDIPLHSGVSDADRAAVRRLK
ncbi:MAG TPA: matrixin family metalloprotease [Bryobacteraceae bacterium]|nr:matrixin family metalloprotease [Bryobacteraceae bacterium]